MNHSQQELRRAAAKAFMESLDQLGTSLTTDATPADATPADTTSADVTAPTAPKKSAPDAIANQAISVEALEDAVADIEQFIQETQQEPDQDA